jgi:betaine-aldehyde dehydrogenase
MELGGKSAAIVWDDHLLEDATRATYANVISNTGQTCAALTRLVVPEHLLATAEGILTELVATQIVGNPRAAASTIGPMSNRGQRDTVEAYLREAAADARVRLVAQASMDGVSKGWFVPPTVFTASDHTAPIVQEEIFGPVLTVQPYSTHDEAIFLANATRFGLISRVWTDDSATFQKVAEQMQVGGVIQSGRPTATEAPFGGVKDSGYGRERGLYGLEEYLVPKSIQAY